MKRISSKKQRKIGQNTEDGPINNTLDSDILRIFGLYVAAKTKNSDFKT